MKIATAWIATIFTSWADFAAFLAAGYTLCLWGEWVWKKFGRAFFERRGWITPRSRRAGDKHTPY